MRTIDIYFLDGINTCHIVNSEDLPESARYICTVDESGGRYSVYDGQEWEPKFYAVKVS
jgi:hypothetical protein